MKITINTTHQEIWEYHVELLGPFLDMIESGDIPDPSRVLGPLAKLQVHVDAQAKHYGDESYRRGIELKAAEAQIRQLGGEVEKLRHYQEVVEQAMADAEM